MAVDPHDVREPGEGDALSLEALLARKTPRARRALQIASLIVVCMLAAGLVFRQYRLGHASFPGSPIATPVAMAALVESNTTWGTLTFDGKRLGGPPPKAVTIASGNHVLTLSAPPFALATCKLTATVEVGSVTFDLRGPCHVGSIDLGSATMVIAFSLSSANLTAVEQSAALQTMTSGLARLEAHVIVPTGDFYVSGIDAQGNILSRRAAAPLAGTLDVVLQQSTGGLDPLCGGSECGEPWAAPPASGNHVWALDGLLSLHWHFADGRGKVVGDASFDVNTPLLLYLAPDGANSWRLAGADGSPVAAPDIPAAATCAAGATIVGPGGRALLSVQDVRGTVSHGCEIAMQTQNGAAAGVYLWRFGALLASDARAHLFAPALPLAPPSESAAVGSLSAQ
jgi:hypothetical protein